RPGQGPHDLFGSLDRRVDGRCAELPVAHDVFQRDDGVVDQHSDAEGEAAEGDHVERHVEQIQEEERGDRRYRNGDTDDERGRDGTEKDEQHGHGDQAAHQTVFNHRADRHADHVGVVPDHLKLHRLAILFNQAVELGADAVRDGDRVRLGLFLHAHRNARGAVEPCEAGLGLVRVRYPGDGFDAHDAARPDVDHGLGNLVKTGEFAHGAHGEFPAVGAHGTYGIIQVAGGQSLHALLDGAVVLFEAQGIELDANFPLRAAFDGDRGASVDALKARFDHIFGEAAYFGQIFPAADIELENRVDARVELKHLGLLDGVRQVALDEIEPLAHFQSSEVHVGAPVELCDDRRPAGFRDGRDPADVAHRRDDLFDRPGHLRLHFPRTHIRIFDDDGGR